MPPSGRCGWWARRRWWSPSAREAAAPLIRSGLLDHWDAEGWRFLLYAGAPPPGTAEERAEPGGRPGPGAGHPPAARAVSVLFARDPRATLDNAGKPLVRVTVVDERSQRPVDGLLADVSARTVLPLVH